MIDELVRRLLPSRVRGYLERRGTALLARLLEGRIPNMEWSLRNLRRQGFRPRYVADVGAYEGRWTRLLRDIHPEAAVLMVEPLESRQPGLEALASHLGDDVELSNALLGREPGREVSFYELDDGSSILEERSGVPRERSIRHTSTLDLEAERHGFPGFDLVKLDVQGYELEVLRGARQSLRRCEAIVTEVSFLEINRGAPLVGEVVAFLKAAGFVAYDVCTIFRRPLDNALWQLDMIFVREDSELRSSRRFD